MENVQHIEHAFDSCEFGVTAAIQVKSHRVVFIFPDGYALSMKHQIPNLKFQYTGALHGENFKTFASAVRRMGTRKFLDRGKLHFKMEDFTNTLSLEYISPNYENPVVLSMSVRKMSTHKPEWREAEQNTIVLPKNLIDAIRDNPVFTAREIAFSVDPKGYLRADARMSDHLYPFGLYGGDVHTVYKTDYNYPTAPIGFMLQWTDWKFVVAQLFHTKTEEVELVIKDGHLWLMDDSYQPLLLPSARVTSPSVVQVDPYIPEHIIHIEKFSLFECEMVDVVTIKNGEVRYKVGSTTVECEHPIRMKANTTVRFTTGLLRLLLALADRDNDEVSIGVKDGRYLVDKSIVGVDVHYVLEA